MTAARNNISGEGSDMIKTGLVSITFRQLTPEQIVRLVEKAGLQAIEWGGDVHAPHGDTEAARKVRKLTEQAGLEISSYGSYYRVGVNGSRNPEFNEVLDTALELQAPCIRVWAGNKEAQECEESYYRYIADQTQRIAELCAKHNISIAYEYHNGTLTNTAESTIKLLKMVNHPYVTTYWQPIHGAGVEKNSKDLKKLIEYVSNVHVFHWWPDERARRMLKEGEGHWKEYFRILGNSGKKRYALLEFVKNDKPENFLEDAKTLKGYCFNTD